MDKPINIFGMSPEELSALVESINNGETTIEPSLGSLLKGYGSYATEVATERAIVSIDGFKPSQRRILYALCVMQKVRDLVKSTAAIGFVSPLHPHGDGAIYDTIVRMVNDTQYLNVPFLSYKGSFGHVNLDSKPSAARYTYVKPNDFAFSFVRDMSGVEMVLTEDGHYEEPKLLPSPVPNILYNPTSGIAVGVASDILPYNANELNEAVIELIQTGDISKPLVPDFGTKGFIVNDPKNFEKIMRTGKGQIKIRGNWVIDGRKIIINELPYYTKVETIIKEAEKIQGISKTENTSDKDGIQLEVTCSNKSVVNEVLTALLRDTSLQMKKGSNLVVILDDKPQQVGVVDLLRRWVEFRKGVIRKSLESDKEYYEREIPQYELIVALMKDIEKRNLFINKLTKENSSVAKMYLMEAFPNYPKEAYEWVMNRSLKSLSGVASKESKLASLRASLADTMKNLERVEDIIISELKEYNAKNKHPRQCQITGDDYNFDNEEKVIVKAKPVECIFTIKDKFIKKVKTDVLSKDMNGIRCMSDDVISIIDTKGRLLRVVLDNIEFSYKNDQGIYLPVYLDTEDDFDVVAYDVIQDKETAFVYSDGFVSVLDYNEWVDATRITRMTPNGVSPLASLIVAEINPNHEYTMLLSRQGKIGFVSNNFKRKNRTARTKLITLKKDDEIIAAHTLSYMELLTLITSPTEYMDKLNFLNPEHNLNVELYNEIVNR